MKIEKIIERYMGEDTYVVSDGATKKTFVIDPGARLVGIMDYVKREKLNVEYIILTHGHGDHITNTVPLKEATGAKIVAHINEKDILMDKNKNLSATLPSNNVEFAADIYVKDGDTMKIGEIKVKFIHTQGRTPGGMCIKTGNHMFTGDTLCAGSMGRTDFYGGNPSLMNKSLKKLTKQEDNVAIYPGHGLGSTIKIEKMTNPFMR